MEFSASSRILHSKYQKKSHLLLPRATKDQLPEPEDIKTFFFDSEDQYIKKILMSKGWKPSVGDKNCGIQWVYHVKHNTFSELSKNTKINHFPHSHLLTTKLGLSKTLKGQKNALIGDEGHSHSTFYPRSYDLSEQNDDFIKDFKQTAVLNLLKKVMIAIEIENSQLFDELHQSTRLFTCNKTETNWIKTLEALYKQGNLYKTTSLKQKSFVINGKIFQSLLWYFSLIFTLDGEGQEEGLKGGQINVLAAYSQLDPPYRSLEEHYENDKTLIKCPSTEALKIFFGLYWEAINRFCWFRTDGLRNVWIVKANDSSRGRSIFLVSSLQQLKSLNSGTRLIQKYLEDVWIFRNADPLLYVQYPFLRKIQDKKFDIRIWVLVRSFSPLQVFIYQQGYLRISQEEYQLNQLDRNCAHLTNFSVNWKTSHHDPENSYVMLSEFMDYLDQQHIKSKEELTYQIRSIIVQTLQAVDLGVSHSDPRCFELYGYDIILDSALRPWLLEVNMSPACKERGRLVQELEVMGKGLLSLIGAIDHSENEQKWIPLTPVQNYRKIYKQKENWPPILPKTEPVIRPVLSKCFSVRSTDDKVKTLLPSIAKGDSIHFKQQNLPSPDYSSNCGLMITGTGFSPKGIKKLDRFVNVKFAVQVFEKLIKRQKGKHKKEIEKPPLNFLRLVESLIVLTAKTKLKFFKKMKKMMKKRSLHLKYIRSF